MPKRSLWLIILLSCCVGVLVFEASRRYDDSRTDTIAQDLLERVYVRALREYYEFLSEVRALAVTSDLGSEEPIDLDLARSPMAFYVTTNRADVQVTSTDWQVAQSLDDLTGRLTSPLRSQENVDILLSLLVGNQTLKFRIDIEDWIASLCADMGFDRLASRLDQVDIQLSAADRQRFAAFPDFMASDLVLYLDADPVRARFSQPTFAILTSLSAILVTFLLCWLARNNQRRRQQAEIERDQSLSKAAGLSNQLEKAQEHVYSVEKLANLGEISAGIAHEVNNPMAYIESNLIGLQDDLDIMMDFIRHVDLTLQRPGLDPRLTQPLLRRYQQDQVGRALEVSNSRLQDCLDGVARIDQIVRDMRKLTHSGDGLMQICDVNRDFISVINIARSRLPSQVQLNVNLLTCPPILCNPSQVSQVLMNLLVNAIQAIGAGPGVIAVDQEVTDRHILIKVMDDGPGMAPEVAEHIFEPFFTTKPTDQGSGMGLSLCYKLIREHRGDITLDTTPDRGSCFTITLPIMTSEEHNVIE